VYNWDLKIQGTKGLAALCTKQALINKEKRTKKEKKEKKKRTYLSF